MRFALTTTATLACLVVACLALGATGSPAGAQPSAAACEQLAGLRIENAPGRSDTNLLSTAVVPARAGLPAYCRVLGYVRPAINFEARLPLEGWNGKFHMAGCGGFCGFVDADRAGFINAINYALKRGYAVSATDAGHWGSGVTDARWAHDNRPAEVDWGSRAVHETAQVTRALIEAFYGQAPDYAYFQGCSTGGRMAAMEAQRFAEDFDGIISGAPALDYTGLVATFFAWVTQANAGPDGKLIGPDDVDLIQRAVLEACDAGDGLADGLIRDPRACDFDPTTLQCPAGGGTGCLSEAEVAVLEKWYGGAKNAAGEQLYPGGIPLGSEPFWRLWLTGDAQGGGGLIPYFGEDFLRYMAFADDPGPAYSIHQFDFEKDPARLDVMGAIYNATDPDLSAFRQAGGKLLMWHGWADTIVPPQLTVDYYEQVEARMGGRAATGDFFRLFMIPGMDHCGLQPGPGITEAGFDPLSALERWVEEGQAPEQLIATKTDAAGAVLWRRPLCPYPRSARYLGGSTEQADRFECVAP
jgi:feruloyl esterase